MNIDTTWLAGGLESIGLWLLTYSAHSTVLLGVAWLLHRRLPRYSETLWKTALLGGLLTSSIQLALGLPSLGGTLAVAGSDSPAQDSASTTVTAPAPAVQSSVRSIPVWEPSSSTGGLPPIAVETESRTASASPTVFGLPLNWVQLAAVFWLIGAVAFTTRLGAQYVRFRLQVRGRRHLSVGDLAQSFEDLLRRSRNKYRIRITSARGITVPFAKGGLRREICLPERVLTDLNQEKQEAILAHELAHHESNDPVWHLLNELTAALLFFQPLNRKACRELREQAELRCDRRAVALTGRPVALARCLTEVASWTLPQVARPMAALTPDGSSLSRRVSQLLAGTGAANRGSARWAVVLSVSLLLLALALAPGFSSETKPVEVEAPVAPVVTEIEPPTAVVVAPALPPTPTAYPVAVPTFVTPPSVVAPTPTIVAAPVVSVSVAATPALIGVAPLAPVAIALAAPNPAPAPEPRPAPEPQEERVEQEDVDDENSDELDQAIEAEMEALEEAMEEIEEIVETEIESVMEEVEEAIELQAEFLEEEIESQMESMEETFESLGEELEKKAEALAAARSEGADEAEIKALTAEVGAMGRAMGELGAIVGRHFGANFGADIAAAVAPISAIAGQLGSQQGELGRLIGERVRLMHTDGRQPTPEEIKDLRAEVRRLAEEMRPQREAIEQMKREIEENLGPLRERMRESQEEMRIEIEDWRRKYEAEHGADDQR